MEAPLRQQLPEEALQLGAGSNKEAGRAVRTYALSQDFTDKIGQNLEALTQYARHFHPLTAGRKGQWACRLQGGLRLVFVPGARGEMVLKEISAPYLTITEITDYHH